LIIYESEVSERTNKT